MTNLAMINDVEERINAENIIEFPVRFTKSRKMFAQLDAIIIQMEDLKAKAEKLQSQANDIMMEEYMENESYRIAHEFLSAVYNDVNKMKTMDIGEGLIKNLCYGNSKAIKDHEGRWFKTVKDACRYHGVKRTTFEYRRRIGCSLEECFMPERKKRECRKGQL